MRVTRRIEVHATTPKHSNSTPQSAFGLYPAQKQQSPGGHPRLAFHKERKRFEGAHTRKYAGESVAFIGDKEPVDATVRCISELLNAKGRKDAKLGMVPAEAFFKVLASKRFRDIGGAPQVTKVYDHMNMRHFGVYWPPDVPDEDQDIYLRGRRLKPYEVLDHPWVYEPSTTNLFWHDFSPDQRRAVTAERAVATKAKANALKLVVDSEPRPAQCPMVNAAATGQTSGK